MNEAVIAQTIMTGLILIIFLGFLIWGIKSGQFNNIEEPKYRMLENNLKSKGAEKKIVHSHQQRGEESKE